MLAAIEAEEKGSRSRLRVAATASEYSLIFSMCRRCSSGSAGACLGELGGHAGSSRGEAAAGSARGSRKRPWRPLLGVVGSNGRGVVGNMSRLPRGNVGRLLIHFCVCSLLMPADSTARGLAAVSLHPFWKTCYLLFTEAVVIRCPRVSRRPAHTHRKSFKRHFGGRHGPRQASKSTGKSITGNRASKQISRSK